MYDDDDLRLSRFERELIRHLRALPFDVQQHVARNILKLQRQHGTIQTDPVPGAAPGEPGTPQWTITVDELAKIRNELELDDDSE